MNRLHPIRLCALLGCCAALGASYAAPMAKDDYSAQKSKIEADYKAAKEQCKSLAGNAKDVCTEEAKGNEKIAKAELDARRDDKPRNHERVAMARADAAHEVAKEKCDDLAGNSKDVCRKEAKAAHAKAVADAKASAHTTTARTDVSSRDATAARSDSANRDAQNAQYKAEVEKCDALSGDAKTSCVNAAKMRFHKS